MNISQAYLYKCGLVACKDHEGKQAPALQGLFADVFDKIDKLEGIKWVLVEGKELKEVSKEEWVAQGRKIKTTEFRTKDADAEFLAKVSNPGLEV